METMIHKGELPPPCAMRYGFVKQKLVDLFGEDAWLQPMSPEAVCAFDLQTKEESV